MIFPDINLLIYAYDTSFSQQARCLEWFESLMNGEEKVGFSWHTLLGFIRIITTPRSFTTPFSSEEALRIAGEMMASPNSVLLIPGEKHLSIIRDLVKKNGIAGKKISDVHLAALAIEHGATLASADRDFRLFDGLKLINPLAD